MLVTTTLNVSLPTTREDGSPLTAADISSVQIWSGNVSGQYSVSVASGTPADLPMTVQYDNSIDKYFAAIAYDQQGRSSAFGPELVKLAVPVAAPSAPGAPVEV